MTYQNKISILRNILKNSNDNDLIDYNFKKSYLKCILFIKKIEIMKFITLIIVIKNIVKIYMMNYPNFIN